jgi:hypothetical protein
MNRFAAIVRSVLVGFFVLGGVLVCLKWLPFPFLWIYGFGVLACFLAGRRGGKSLAVICFNIGSVFFMLAVAELFLEVADRRDRRELERTKSFGLYESIEDPVLGNVLIPNSSRRAWKSHDGRMVFDVTYTIDQNGLRVAPPCSEPCNESALFFGDSFTYGEGVNDHETLPYQFGMRSLGKLRVYNFAIHGHGPQLMLAQIESGRVRSVAPEKPAVAVYQAIYPEHVHRLLGRRDWVRRGPKYVLDSDRRVLHSGRFSDDDWDSPAWSLFQWQIRKSALARRFLSFTPPVRARDEDLFVTVVIQSAKLLRQLNPALEFHFILWGEAPERVLSRLKVGGVSVHSAAEIIEAGSIPKRSASIEGDGHPTPAVYALLADYVLCSIRGRGGVGVGLGPACTPPPSREGER